MKYNPKLDRLGAIYGKNIDGSSKVKILKSSAKIFPYLTISAQSPLTAFIWLIISRVVEMNNSLRSFSFQERIPGATTGRFCIKSED